jgi:hypothetical protein
MDGKLNRYQNSFPAQAMPQTLFVNCFYIDLVVNIYFIAGKQPPIQFAHD